MGKKIKKDIDIIGLHKYIKGLEIAVKQLDILTSIEGSFVRYNINLVDILDEKERELSYINTILDKVTLVKKSLQTKCTIAALKGVQKELKISQKKFDYAIEEEMYFLVNHILSYEKKIARELKNA